MVQIFLEKEYGETDRQGLLILAIDEIFICKGHRYLTLVMDYLKERIVKEDQDHKAHTLRKLF